MGDGGFGGYLGNVVQGRVDFHVLGSVPRMLPGGVFERDSAQLLASGAQEHFFELPGRWRGGGGGENPDPG